MNKQEGQENNLDQELKLLARSSVIVFLFLFISKLLFYLYRLIIARSLGPEIYGLFSISLIILSLFVSFFSLGFDQGLLRFISLYRARNQNKKVRYLFHFSVKILLLLSILAAVTLFSLSNFISINIFHNRELTIFLRIFSLIIPIYIFSYLFLSILRAYEKVTWYSFILNVFQNVIKVLSIIILIFLGIKSNAIIISYSLGVLGMFLLAIYLSNLYFKDLFRSARLRMRERIKIRKEFLSYSWPLMFLGILSSIFYWTDSFMIGYFKSAVEVGFYNAAFPIAALMGFAPEIFMQLFFPLITKEFSRKNFSVIKELSQQVGKWIFILNLPLLILMVLFPGAIINFLFGPDYIISENSLRILAVGIFFATLSVSIPSNLLSAIGKSKLLLANLIIVSIFNIILNLFLIPRYGINGAAISTTLSNFLFGTILIIEIRYYTSITPLRKKILKIFAVSLIPIFLLLYLKTIILISTISLILLGSLFFLSYILLISVTGCLDKNDFLIIDLVIKKYIKK